MGLLLALIMGKTQAGKVTKAKAKDGKKQKTKYVVDCVNPVEDAVMLLSDYADYMRQRIKVNGKTNNLGKSVTIETTKNKLEVETTIPFSKRYLKYLTKKYLKKNNLRDFLRVVATSKYQYKLNYFQINEEEAE